MFITNEYADWLDRQKVQTSATGPPATV